MTNEEIKAYTREQMGQTKTEGFFKKLRTTEMCELAEYAIVFLLARLEFLGGLSPFGIACFAAAFPTQKRSFGIFFACLGVALGSFGIESLKYMGCIAIVSAFSIFLKEELANKKLVYSLIAAGSIAANGFIYVAFDGFLVYDILFLTFEAILTFFSYFAFDKAIELLRNVKVRNCFEAEETISLLILSACVILSVKTLPYCEGLSHITSIAILMMLGYSCGSQAAAAGGIVLGLVNAMGAPLAAQTVSVYSLCGFGCGLFKKYGKWAVSLSFLVINAIFMMYFNSSMDRLLTVGYIAAATVVLYALPQSFLSRFGAIAKGADELVFSPYGRLKEILSDKLNAAGNSFGELADIFSKIVETRLAPELCDIDRVYDRAYSTVCKNCSMNKYCWQSKATDTYDSLGKMYEMMKVRGYAIDIDAPKHFKEYCINFDEFLSALNKEYEHYRVNLMWAGKIIESRKLISDQFKCISNVLGKIKEEVNSDFSNNIRLEKRIMTALDKKGIAVTNICVTNRIGYEVTMMKNSCEGRLECSKIIAAAVSEILEVPMLRVGRKCSNDICELKFCEQARFKVETGGCEMSKSGENKSGDNYSCMLLDEGRYITVLSDGMGSGKRANAQSAVTVEMLKRLMRAGFDKETSVKLINSILMSHTNNELFATVDICIVNLYTGTAEFLKTGAAASFIKSKSGVEEISCSTLPAGILTEVKTDATLVNLTDGSYIVMATDGTIDAVNRAGMNMNELIGAFTGDTAQQLADGIMSYAAVSSAKEIKDDMTVFVIKLTEEM